MNDLINRADALAFVNSKVTNSGYLILGCRVEQGIAAIPAVTPAINAGAVKVKPLVWEIHPMGWIAAPPTGHAYIIDVRIKGRAMFIKGMNPPPKFSDLEAAKAAAQADYAARILSAIETTPDPRDAVIAWLVEALETYRRRATRISLDVAVYADDAIAAAKAVMK